MLHVQTIFSFLEMKSSPPQACQYMVHGCILVSNIIASCSSVCEFASCSCASVSKIEN